jgi:hypothetical protein
MWRQAVDLDSAREPVLRVQLDAARVGQLAATARALDATLEFTFTREAREADDETPAGGVRQYEDAVRVRLLTDTLGTARLDGLLMPHVDRSPGRRSREEE